MHFTKNKTLFPFPREPKNLEDFEEKIKIVFIEKKLLKQAFTHRSFLNENRRSTVGNNERLEFLGDAVIELIVSNYLYKTYPEIQEGELTKYRSSLVNAETFVQIAYELRMNNYMLLSEGQRREAGRFSKNVLADAFEAFVGAVFLDQGYITAEKFIYQHLLSKAQVFIEQGVSSDSKSILQEKAQAVFNFTPIYEVMSETGHDHDKVYVVEVFYGDKTTARGTGSSKREAEQKAAHNALESKGWS